MKVSGYSRQQITRLITQYRKTGKCKRLEVVCTVEKISERYLIPALEQLLENFPFQVLGFHSDNGSECINKTGAKLLEKLRIEFTKSRSRQTNDNALAESTNGAVVRKLFGHTHIPQHWTIILCCGCHEYPST